MRVFLSHSHLDKESYVDCVSKKLSSDDVIIDERSFKEGRLSSEEMKRLIDECEIFVLFISNNSLESKGVRYEISQYEKHHFKNEKKFVPLIIEDKVKYDDNRIPEWMRDYNLRLVTRPKKACACISEIIRIITWKKYDFIKKKDLIFRGRNEYIEKFERRYNDRKVGKAICYCVSGLDSIGRTSFLMYCLKKVNKISQEHSCQKFTLGSNESIEDFIFKINELGVTKPVDVENLMGKTIDEKIQIASEQLREFYRNDEVVHIIDNGSIITSDGHIAGWFQNVLNDIDEESVGARLTIAAKYGCRELLSQKIWNISIPELSPLELQWLLEDYLNLYEVCLTNEEFETCLNWLQGYPQQVLFLAQAIYYQGFGLVRDNSKDIVAFNTHKVIAVLAKYSGDERKKSFIATLAMPELLNVNDLMYSFDNDVFYKDLLTDLVLSSVCIFEGVSNEYVRVNNTIRDYINRKRFSVNEVALEKITDRVISNFKSDTHGIPEYSELYFYMNKFIKEEKNIDKIDSKYIFPSHFAKCMQEIYNRRKDDDEVIRIAEFLISKKRHIDKNIIETAYYYLCLALARKKDIRVLTESKKLNEKEKHFVCGFYYRKICKWYDSIDSLTKTLELSKNKHKRAKRELVIDYIHLEEYDKAFQLAKESYESDPLNVHFAQAYFTCLLRSGHEKNNTAKELKNIINIIDTTAVGDDERDKSMLVCMKAEYEFYINDKIEEAYSILDDYIREYPTNIYALFSKFNIAEKISDISEMERIQKIIKETIRNKDQYEDIIMKNDIRILAHKGDKNHALEKIDNLPRDYSDRYKEKLRSTVAMIAK